METMTEEQLRAAIRALPYPGQAGCVWYPELQVRIHWGEPPDPDDPRELQRVAGEESQDPGGDEPC